jgi:glycosyltransferase involved in cell wall biosynthesis
MQSNVTAVIPTRNRPDMVMRAVHSALAQTCPVDEVIVVVDGPDEVTVQVLAEVGDARIRCLVLPVNGGANNARNVGAASARTEWVAFLDDDDEWLPNKIEKQLAIAAAYDIVGCRFLVSTTRDKETWPKRLPAAGEKFGDYLFARRSLFKGEAAVITSALLVRKTLLDKVPLSTSLRRHQDADWAMRATEAGARLCYVPDTLMIFNDDVGRIRISTTHNWRQSLEWIRSARGRLNPRAYAGFVLTTLGALASSQSDWTAFVPLLREAVVIGRPTPLHLLLYCGMWAFPQNLRQRLRFFLSPAMWRARSAS